MKQKLGLEHCNVLLKLINVFILPALLRRVGNVLSTISSNKDSPEKVKAKPNAKQTTKDMVRDFIFEIFIEDCLIS